ncbi:hypothetical protein WJX82_002411 [Trebouxia sp. C0006]
MNRDALRADAAASWSRGYSHLAFKLRIQSSGSDVAESGPDDYRLVSPYKMFCCAFVYRGVFQHLEYCAHCCKERFHSHGTHRRAISWLIVCPFAEHIKYLWGHPDLARMLSWPSERKQHGFKESVLYDVYDGEQWATAVLGDDHIAPGGELGRNLVFGVCGNGVDLMEHKNHSLWPLPITCFNLPARLRYTLPALGLVCIIPPNSKGGEPEGFQPFMDIFADQMRYLYQYGVQVFDGSHR